MQPHVGVAIAELGRGSALRLLFGVLLSHGGIAMAADAVAVKVSRTPIAGWTCSDPQVGDVSRTSYYVCVDKANVTTTNNAGKAAVTWTLDPAGGWVFPYSQGIDIDAKGNKKGSNGRKKWTVAACTDTECSATNDKENGSKKYAYTINVLNGRYLLTFDPTIMN